MSEMHPGDDQKHRQLCSSLLIWRWNAQEWRLTLGLFFTDTVTAAATVIFTGLAVYSATGVTGTVCFNLFPLNNFWKSVHHLYLYVKWMHTYHAYLSPGSPLAIALSKPLSSPDCVFWHSVFLFVLVLKFTCLCMSLCVYLCVHSVQSESCSSDAAPCCVLGSWGRWSSLTDRMRVNMACSASPSSGKEVNHMGLLGTQQRSGCK